MHVNTPLCPPLLRGEYKERRTVDFPYFRGEDMSETEKIITAVLKHYPDVQAVYLFGSYGTDEQWSDSDVDIALLYNNSSLNPR